MAKRTNRRQSKRTGSRAGWWPPVDKSLFLFILGLFMLLVPGQNKYTVTYAGMRLDPVKETGSEITIPDPAPYPVNRTGVRPDAGLTAFSVVVRDADSGVFLYEKESTVTMAPASITKIMTAIVASDMYRPDEIVTVGTPLTEGQTMDLVPGERITVENLLYATLIHSANDAAFALSEHIQGGEKAFVAAMNRKAAELHLTGSVFTNPMGFDDPGQRVTARDMSLLASYFMENKSLMKMVSLPAITVSDVTYTHFHRLKNVNELLGQIQGVAGIKTGWTEEAGENLVTLVERNGKRIILVVLKSEDRFADTMILIDWVFNNHVWETYFFTEPD